MPPQNKPSFLEKLFSTFKPQYFFAVLGFILYSPSIFGAFVYDDIVQIVNNSYVHSINNVFIYFINPNTTGFPFVRFYRPLTYSVYTLFYSLFGQSTFFYHLFQTSIFIASVYFLFLILKRFFKFDIPILLATIYLVHPINVEIVAYIADLQDVLYCFFGLLALFIVLRREKFNVRLGLLISFLLILSFFSKETGILFIPILILFGLFFKKSSLRFSIIYSTLSLIIYGVFRFIIANNYSPVSLTQMSVIRDQAVRTTVLLSSPKIFFYYLSAFFCPINLTIFQRWLVNKISFSSVYIPLFFDLSFLTVISVVGYYIYRTRRENLSIFIFFLTWFVLGMILCFPIWLLDQTVSNRWFYFPMIGFLGIIGLILNLIKINNYKIKIIFRLLTFTLISILSVVVLVRSSNFQTRLTLYAHEASTSNDAQMYRVYEEELIKDGKFDDAEKVLTKLNSLDPDNSLNLWYAGLINENLGNYSKASEYYKKLLPTIYGPYAYFELPRMFIFREKDYEGAEKILKEGINKDSKIAYLWELLAVSEYNLQKKTEALTAIETAKNLSDTQEIDYIYNQILNDLPIKANYKQ